MGEAMQRAGNSPILTKHPSLSFKRGNYTYLLESRTGRTTLTVSDGVRSVSYPILWSFGYGNQTWVFERDGQLYESLVSYYKSIGGLDITTGDADLPVHSLEDAAGRQLIPAEAKDCFGCHSSNSALDGKLNLPAIHPGVSCASCHKEAPEHLADILKGRQDTIPASLGSLSAEEMSNFCGTCHRSWEKIVRNGWHGEINVRFQPYRLANSKCFDGADPRISCVACHDPHQRLVQEPAFYDNKCLACHAAATRSASSTAQTDAKTCPVSGTNCVTCHMPKVNFPGGRLVYTDHQIRIAKPGDPYPD